MDNILLKYVLVVGCANNPLVIPCCIGLLHTHFIWDKVIFLCEYLFILLYQSLSMSLKCTIFTCSVSHFSWWRHDAFVILLHISSGSKNFIADSVRSQSKPLLRFANKTLWILWVHRKILMIVPWKQVKITFFKYIFPDLWVKAKYFLTKYSYPYLISNFNGATVGVWESRSNFIPHFIMDVITYNGCNNSSM